jgi:CheY-like chemotaxis protein
LRYFVLLSLNLYTEGATIVALPGLKDRRTVDCGPSSTTLTIQPDAVLTIGLSAPTVSERTKATLEMSPVRILIVDDFEPFRRFIRSTLRQKPEWQIIGEASDGLEAVQKVEELQPDLIVLDIGLPTLNGIKAARQIRKLRPECRILFLSQETSADIVQEAFSLGAVGYVVKAYAGSELLVAVKAVCSGGRFMGKGLSSPRFSYPRVS